MPDKLQLCGAVTFGRLMQLRADSGKSRKINDRTPAHAPPDTSPYVNVSPIFFFRHKVDPGSPRKLYNIIDNTNRRG